MVVLLTAPSPSLPTESLLCPLVIRACAEDTSMISPIVMTPMKMFLISDNEEETASDVRCDEDNEDQSDQLGRVFEESR